MIKERKGDAEILLYSMNEMVTVMYVQQCAFELKYIPYINI